MAHVLKIYSVVILSFLCSFSGTATHIRGGVITLRKLDNLKFEFTFIGYRDRGSTIPFGGGNFYFGDGSGIENVIAQGEISVTPINDDFDSITFKVVHQYQEAGTYTVSYSEEYRNADIINMSNSVITSFYVETMFNTEVDNTSPLPTGKFWAPFHVGELGLRNFQFSDHEGDLLRYTLTVPMQSPYHLVNLYRYPDFEGFYSDFENGNFSGNGVPVFSVDRMTGTLVWDAPGDAIIISNREYGVAVKVDEYRVVDDVQKRISSTIADFVLTVEESPVSPLNVIRQGDKFCSEGLMEFEVNSGRSYSIKFSPPSLVSSINEVEPNEILDSVFTSDSKFTVAFTDFEEGEFVTFDVSSDSDEEIQSSFTYLLSEQCDLYLLDTQPTPLKERILLYPNPAVSEVWVHNVSEDLRYVIVGLDGKEVLQGLSKGHIDLAETESGLYIIRFYRRDNTGNDWQLLGRGKLVVKK